MDKLNIEKAEELIAILLDRLVGAGIMTPHESNYLLKSVYTGSDEQSSEPDFKLDNQTK